MRYRASCIALLAAAALAAGPSVHAGAQAIGYDELLARLADAHPDYRAMQGEVRAAEAGVEVAAAWPDPVLRVELRDIDDYSVVPDHVGSTKYTYEQMFPLWGKRQLKRDAAAAGLQVARARAELTLSELRAMLRVAYAEYFSAHTAAAINAEVGTLLEELALSAKTRYANGLAAQQDVIKSRTEQTMLAAEQELLAGEALRARVMLNSLIGADAEAPLPPPAGLPDTSGFLAACARLEAAGDAHSPALAVAERSVAQRRAARDLAARERYPDLSVGISPVRMDGRFDTWELMLGMQVPLFGGRRAMEAESAAMLASAEERLAAERRRVLADAAQARADYQAASAQRQTFENRLRSEAELNFRSALAGYQAGQVDFDTLIEAERQIRGARLQSLAAAVRQQRAVAEFEQRTGVHP